jgi:hypothetical protein
MALSVRSYIMMYYGIWIVMEILITEGILTHGHQPIPTQNFQGSAISSHPMTGELMKMPAEILTVG